MHKNPFRDGFALIELFVILAILAIVSGMLMPIVSRVKADRTSVGCQTNGRQLIWAMHLCAAGFNELLLPNEDNKQFKGWGAGGYDRCQPRADDREEIGLYASGAQL